MSSSEVLCYNKGCGQRFSLEDNAQDVCQYHPGVPVFHDALKGWSCCKKRTTDFSDFLNIPGCTKGLHSNEKPKEPIKPVVATSKEDLASQATPKSIVNTPIQAPKPRPSFSEPMVPLRIKMTSSLQHALKKMNLETENADNGVNNIKQIKVCQHQSCSVSSYECTSDVCVYHPGVPVFHEGLKFWSCCQRKTTDFTSFLEQKGCETGSHEWKVKSCIETGPCRYDWHQTGSVVVISIFAKTAVVGNSAIKANQIGVDIDLEYEGGKRNFKLNLELFGIIDPILSDVSMFGTKVEVTLKKGEIMHWKKLGAQKENSSYDTSKEQENEKLNTENSIRNIDEQDRHPDDDDSDLSGIEDVEFD